MLVVGLLVRSTLSSLGIFSSFLSLSSLLVVFGILRFSIGLCGGAGWGATRSGNSGRERRRLRFCNRANRRLWRVGRRRAALLAVVAGRLVSLPGADAVRSRGGEDHRCDGAQGLPHELSRAGDVPQQRDGLLVLVGRAGGVLGWQLLLLGAGGGRGRCREHCRPSLVRQTLRRVADRVSSVL